MWSSDLIKPNIITFLDTKKMLSQIILESVTKNHLWLIYNWTKTLAYSLRLMSTHRLWWRQKRRRSTSSPSWLSSTIWSCPALPGFLLLMTMMIMLHILKLVNFDDNWEGRMFYHVILSCPARLLQLPLMTMIMLQDGGDNFDNNQAFVSFSIWGWHMFAGKFSVVPFHLCQLGSMQSAVRMAFRLNPKDLL